MLSPSPQYQHMLESFLSSVEMFRCTHNPTHGFSCQRSKLMTQQVRQDNVNFSRCPGKAPGQLSPRQFSQTRCNQSVRQGITPGPSGSDDDELVDLGSVSNAFLCHEEI